jgi:O-antigen/teichoic acid export membrane protein
MSMTADTEPKVTGLTKRALAGTAWSSVATVAKQALTLASVATVARILGPRAYGLMAMAVIVTNFIANFRDLGTAVAIVQRPTITRSLLSSLFWINVGVGFLMCSAVAFTAPILAGFFHAPELTSILRWLAFALFLASAGVVHNALLTREMSFRVIAITDVAAAAASYMVALTGALSGLGVWSLVFASVAGAAVSTAGYWIGSSFRPRREFNVAEVRSIARFSTHLSANGLANYAYRNSDNLIVGRVLGSVQLGYYQMAYNLMLTPIQNISSVITSVLFPAFARIQEDNERFRRAYIRACMLTALITFPVMAGLGVVADPLIRAVLGSKWTDTIPIFQILAAVGLLQSVQTTVGIIYQAKGRTDWLFRWSLCVLAVSVLAFVIGVRFGTVGVATAYAIANWLIMAAPCFIVPFRLIGLKLREFVVALIPQLLVTVGMVACCLAWLSLLRHFSVSKPWPLLISTSAVGSLSYISGMLVWGGRALDHAEEILESSDNATLMRVLTLLQRMRVRSFFSPKPDLPS